VGLSSIAFNRWIPKEELVERGFEKLINEYDGKLASEQKVSLVRQCASNSSCPPFA
jgi:elongation factor 3